MREKNKSINETKKFPNNRQVHDQLPFLLYNVSVEQPTLTFHTVV